MKEIIEKQKELSMKRWIGMFLGNLILAIGISILKWSHTGNDPYSGMVMAVAEVLGLSYSVFLICINCAIFLVEIIFGKRYIGVGTLVNWFLLGPVVDLAYPALLSAFGIADGILWKQLVGMLLGVLVVSLGCSLYQTSDAGVAPYDSLAIILEKRTILPYFWARMICDGTCALVCFLAGGVMGMGMLFCALGLGPIIAFFNRFVSKPLMMKKEKAK